ncbi:hypothetical protein BDN67DRAFT_966143 [Paxillus ammoniavirescens]|nr:hypothetical protein BDN67DRAFT_966143 [Paxillus ammoniavirescens]
MPSVTESLIPLQEALTKVKHMIEEEIRRCKEHVEVADAKYAQSRAKETDNFNKVQNQLILLAAMGQSRQNQGAGAKGGEHTAHALLSDIMTQSHQERKVAIEHFAAECHQVQVQGHRSLLDQFHTTR